MTPKPDPKAPTEEAEEMFRRHRGCWLALAAAARATMRSLTPAETLERDRIAATLGLVEW